MDTQPESRALDDARLKAAINTLIDAVRANQSGAAEIAVIMDLVAQLREANQNLVLAAVRAQVLQEEAEIRNRQQNEFLAMLAHELRNPLAPISNAADLLEKLTSAHPLLPSLQGVLSRQVSQMAHLIDDLLDASRITSGKINLHKERITLNEVIDRSVEMIRPLVEKRNQQLDVVSLPAAILIEGDLVRLSQALSNLLINACKFTPEDGLIQLGVRLEPAAALITVRDSGVGIDADLLPHVFELFKQGPRSMARSEGGLGIGLSVAKGLVEMHGGRITAYSKGQNQGSEFGILLPTLMARDAAPEAPAALKERSAIQCCRILLIEDNADTVATLQLILELDGHHVATATDGTTGLALASANPYDVILCDIGLPGMNGYDVIKQVRQHTASASAYVIALSGYSQPEDRQNAIEAGFDYYFVKPLNDDTLLSVIAARPSFTGDTVGKLNRRTGC